jgi:ribosome biogenesis GTPase
MSKKGQRHKNLTDEYLSGSMDEDRLPSAQRFNRRAKHHQANKTARTALRRLAIAEQTGDIDALPLGTVVQVHSLFVDVECDSRIRPCVVRSTLAKVSDTQVVVGDRVRVGEISATSTGSADHTAEGVIERIEPRATLLTRADSFNEQLQAPIIANADQMLIVVSLLLPRVKWGLIDRMLVAARVGGLTPVVCLNKWDLRRGDDRRVRASEVKEAVTEADAALGHLQSVVGITVLRTSVRDQEGIQEMRDLLKDKTTALAGHSGVGKSSLVAAVEPVLSLRTAEVSNYNQKGRHTTTSARLYPLTFGGAIVDTPGVRRFGLWNLSLDTLDEHFPDVLDADAPSWRVESYQRIRRSLGGD